jgi:hypothetical protein
MSSAAGMSCGGSRSMTNIAMTNASDGRYEGNVIVPLRTRGVMAVHAAVDRVRLYVVVPVGGLIVHAD